MDAVGTARNGRSESDILTRAGVPLTLGGREWRVRPRSITTNREWQGQVKEAIGEKFAGLEKVDGAEDLFGYLSGSTDTLLDMVLGYDETGALPDRAWVLDNASDHEVLEALLVLMEQSFPFFDVGRRFLPPDMRGLVMSRVIAAVLSQGWGPSTSEPSTPGASEPPET
jgi:hypothetical protein